MDGWLRVRDPEKQSFTLLNPKVLHWPVTGSPIKIEVYYLYRYFYEASSFQATAVMQAFFIVKLVYKCELLNVMK